MFNYNHWSNILRNYGKGYMYMMYRDPSHQRGVLHCMEYVRTPHMIIQGWEYSQVNILFYLFIFKGIFFGIFNSLWLYWYTTLTSCSLYHNIAGLVTKGYHGCKHYGPSMKARWSKYLWNPVYNFSRVFLLENHYYRRNTSSLNGKPDTNPNVWNNDTDWLA